MNKAKRELYIELAEEVSTPLCSFCKFSDGGDCESWNGCKNPLNKDSYKTLCKHSSYWDEDPEPSDDCWAYRPNLPHDDIVDIVSVILSEGFDEWMYTQKNGQIKVYGNRLRQPA